MPLLNLAGVCTRRGRGALFSPVSFSLAAGEGLALVGPNGSGKTTLLDLIAGLQKPSAGSIVRPPAFGYVMQDAGFQETLSFRDNLLAEAALIGLTGQQARAAATQVAQELDMLEWWRKRYKKGSSGMRGRLGIAAALLGNPALLLLDEVMNYLDAESCTLAHQVLCKAKRRGVALVMVSHEPRHFEGLCERQLALPGSQVSLLRSPDTSATPTEASSSVPPALPGARLSYR